MQTLTRIANRLANAHTPAQTKSQHRPATHGIKYGKYRQIIIYAFINSENAPDKGSMCDCKRALARTFPPAVRHHSNAHTRIAKEKRVAQNKHRFPRLSFRARAYLWLLPRAGCLAGNRNGRNLFSASAPLLPSRTGTLCAGV